MSATATNADDAMDKRICELAQVCSLVCRHKQPHTWDQGCDIRCLSRDGGARCISVAALHARESVETMRDGEG